jgi:predicted MFS family arabinose efflux permease
LSQRAERPPGLAELLGRRPVQLSYAMTMVVMMGGFLIIPNLSTYVQENLHYPRARLQLLYFAGGAVSFFATRYGGRLVDRFGSFRTGTVGAMLAVAVQLGFFVWVPPSVPVIVWFMGFMLALGLRNVAYNTLTSKVPTVRERARFLSLQSAVQHASASAGAFVSAHLLSAGADHALVGMVTVAALAIALTAFLPFMLWTVERRVAPRPR